MIKYLIFDFDGTIADTFDAIKDIAKKELGATDAHFELMKSEGLEVMIKKSNLPFWKIPTATYKVLAQLKNREDAQIFPKLIPIFKQLKKYYGLGVVSNNSEDNIWNILKRNGIADLFDFVYSDSSILGKHLVLKRMCKEIKLNSSEIIYFGDENRDIKAAKKIGAISAGVTWGYNSEDLIRREKPNYIFRAPREIFEKFCKR